MKKKNRPAVSMIDVELVPEAARVVGIEIEGSMVSQHGLNGQIHGWMAAIDRGTSRHKVTNP